MLSFIIQRISLIAALETWPIRCHRRMKVLSSDVNRDVEAAIWASRVTRGWLQFGVEIIVSTEL